MIDCIVDCIDDLENAVRLLVAELYYDGQYLSRECIVGLKQADVSLSKYRNGLDMDHDTLFGAYAELYEERKHQGGASDNNRPEGQKGSVCDE